MIFTQKDPSIDTNDRAKELLAVAQADIYRNTDRLFVGLMVFQWILGIMIALIVSPKTWLGSVSSVHVHVWAAVFLGGAIAIFPILLGIFKPGKVYTRYIIAVAQMLYSSLLIHLTGGRIETHFHVFGSLAFLAFYRDWKVLIPATIVVAVDHWLRGVYWPQSVFGVLTVSPYRWIEHTAWVVFEDIFLIRSCYKSVLEMTRIAKDTAELESKNEQLAAHQRELVELTRNLDKKVHERTFELKQTLEELKNTHSQLFQSEKLASIGQLAAGVAHEINNPVGFISNNMEILQEYIQDYTKILRIIDNLKKQIADGDVEKARVTIDVLQKFEEEINLDYVMNDVNTLLEHSGRGLERIKKIVLDLRTFAREDKKETMELVKVEEVIDSILSIVQNEIKYKAELTKDYGDTPLIKGSPQRLGQVFINLLINACQAIEDKGNIHIKTYQQNGSVSIDISDSGQGITSENLQKIFDPFFTTKPVGQGTGLGLSVSHEIIKKHRGEMKVRSKVGEGTTFTINLPIV